MTEGPALGGPLALLACAALVAGPACTRTRGSLESPIPEERAAAVAALASSRRDADWPALLVSQHDPSPLVRKAAAGALTARGGPRAVEALGQLVRDRDPEVVTSAARGLGAMATEGRARELLAEAYAEAPASGRVEVATALQALGASLREAVESETRRLWGRSVRALANGTPSERAGAAEELGRSGRAEAVRLLAPLIEEDRGEPPVVVAAAARGLGAAGDRSVVASLEELLEAAEDPLVAEAAAEALGTLGDPAASAALARAAARGAGRLAEVAVQALASLPQAPETGVSLCEVALGSPEARVAAPAAAQVRLREASCPEGPLLARLQRGGGDAAAALSALGEIGLRGERLRPAAERALALVESASADPALRAAAARALGRAAFAPAAVPLGKRAALLAERLAVQRELRSLPAPRGPPRPAWSPDVARAEAEELAATLVAAASLKAGGIAKVASALAGDPEETLRVAAAETLRQPGAEIDLDRVAAALADPSPRVRMAGAAAAGRAGPRSVAALARAAREAAPGEADVLGAVAAALGDTGAAEAVAPLEKILEGPAAAAAALALGRLATRDAAAPLVRLLSRPQIRGRVEAIDALAQAGGPDAGPPIAQELTSDRPEVRAAAARALGRLRWEAASVRIEALRGDYYGEVRRAAVEALARFPSRRGGR